MEVGAVKFVAEFDSTVAEQAIEQFRKKLETIKIDLPANAIGSISSSIKKINTIATITPTVDHAPLHALNKHLDLKKKHFDDLNGHLAKNPIKPKIDTGGMALAIPKQQQQQIKENFKLFKEQEKSVKVDKKDEAKLVKTLETGLKADNTVKQALNTQDTLNTEKMSESINTFVVAVQDFEKANKKTLLGSLLRGAMGYIGSSLAQLIVFKVTESVSKGIADYASKAIGSQGSKEEQYLIQKTVEGSITNALEKLVNTEELQKFVVGSYLLTRSMESLTSSIANQDTAVGKMADNLNHRLETFNEGLFELVKEVTITELIHNQLKNLIDLTKKGVGIGFSRTVGAMVMGVLTAPAKILAGALAKSGADKAQTTTIPIQKMMTKILGEKDNEAEKQESLRKGYLMGAVIKGVKEAPVSLIKELFSFMGKSWADVMQSINVRAKAIQFLAPSFLRGITDPLLSIIDKITTQKDQPSFIGKAFAFISEKVQKFNKDISDKINELETSVAEKITGQSLEEIKEQIELDVPVTVEEFLKAILNEVKDIKSIISGKFTHQNDGVVGNPDNLISSSTPIDPQTIARALIPIFNRLRLQGGRLVNGVKEKKEEGGIRMLAQQFPDLNINFKNEQGKNKKVGELKSDLQNIVDNLIETEQFDKLNEIAEFMVRNWEKLAREEHKNYAPDVSGSPVSVRLNNDIDTTDEIKENWNVTGDEIVDELNRLVAISRKVGYQVQRNISEGSPGITKTIRENWKKTANEIIKQMVRLVVPSKEVGDKLSGSFENAFAGLDGFIVDLENKIKNIDFGNIVEKGKGLFGNIKDRVVSGVGKAKDVATETLPTMQMPEFEMPSIKLPDIDLGNVFTDLKTNIQNALEKISAEFSQLSSINVGDFIKEITKNFSSLWVNLIKTIDSQKTIILDKAKVNYKKVYDKAINHLMGGLASAIISIESIQSKAPEVNIPAITLPSFDFQSHFENIKQQISEQIEINISKIKKLFNIDYRVLTTSYIASIKKTWQSILNTIKEQSSIIKTTAKESYTKIYNKAINNIVGGIGSAIIATSSIKIPSIDFSFSSLNGLSDIKEKTNIFVDKFKNEFENLLHIEIPQFEFESSFASIKESLKVEIEKLIDQVNSLFTIDLAGAKDFLQSSLLSNWNNLIATIESEYPNISSQAKDKYNQLYTQAINNIVGVLNSAIITASSIQVPEINFSYEPLVKFFNTLKAKIQDNTGLWTIITKTKNTMLMVGNVLRIRFAQLLQTVNDFFTKTIQVVKANIESINVDVIKDEVENSLKGIGLRIKEGFEKGDTLTLIDDLHQYLADGFADLKNRVSQIDIENIELPQLSITPLLSVFDDIKNNFEDTTKKLNKISKLTNFSEQLKELEGSIKSLRFKMLFNTVKALKKVTKFMDFEINLDDGWKKNLVKFLTRGLYQITKTTLRELGIALGQILTYIIKDVSEVLTQVYNSDQFTPIREDIESFVGQLHDIFAFAQKQFNKITGLFGGRKNIEKEEVIVDNEPQNSTKEQFKEQIYFQRLFASLAKALNELNRQGRSQVAKAGGISFSPTQTGEQLMELIVKKIELDPTALKDVISVIESNWDDIKLDSAEWASPFRDLEEDIENIDKKWGETGNYFTQVLSEMRGTAQKTRKHLTASLADKSPGLTQDIRDRWKFTSKEVGVSMQSMRKEGVSTFQQLTDALSGLKIVGGEVSDSLVGAIKSKVGDVANNLIERGEVKVYDLMGININDTEQVDAMVGQLKSRFGELNEIQLSDAEKALDGFKSVLNKRENIAFQEVRQKLKDLSVIKKEVAQKLANPPKFTNEKGEVDRRAVLKYLSDVEKSIKRYQTLLGDLTQKVQLNPNVQKALKLLPLEAQRSFHSFINSASQGLVDIESLAEMFKEEMISILNLDSESLRKLGIPDSFISQIEELIKKGEDARKALDFSDFQLPTREVLQAQSERTLVNIYDKTAQVQEIQSTRENNQGRKANILNDISRAKTQYEKDYRKLIEQGKTTEATLLKNSYQSYLKQKANQLKEIKQVEAKYAQELAQIAITLGDFSTESEVVAFLKGFDTLSEGLNSLVERIQQGNDELKNSVIEISNTISNQLGNYENAVKEIINIENKLNNIQVKKAQLEAKYEKQINTAREKGNLKEVVKLEQQREQVLQDLQRQQAMLNEKMAEQLQIQQTARETVFDLQESGSLIDINALYETEQPIEDIAEEHLSFFDKIKQGLAGIPKLAQSAFRVLGQGYDQLKEKFPILQSMEERLKKIGIPLLGLAITVPFAFGAISKAIGATANFVVSKMKSISDASFKTAVDFEAMTAQFKFVYGQARGANALKEFEKQTDSLGQSYGKMTKKFIMFRMGLSTVGMEDRAESMTAGIQKALTVREAGVEEGERALNALNQMASKGKVQLDDLNQLREALPGALAVAAQSMNVSASELLTMISQGRLSAEEFLPRFTEAIGRQADPAMDMALDTTLSKLNQLDNRITELQRVMGHGTVELARPLIDGLNVALKFIVEFADEIATVATAIGLNFFLSLVSNVLPSMATITKAVSSFILFAKTGIASLFLDYKAGLSQLQVRTQAFWATQKVQILTILSLAKMAILTILKFLAPIFALAIGIELINGLMNYNKESKKFASDMEKRYDRIFDKLKEIRRLENTPRDTDDQDLKRRKELDELGTGNWAFDLIDGIARSARHLVGLGDVGAGRSISAQKHFDEFENYSAGFRSILRGNMEIDNITNAQGGLDNYFTNRSKLENEIKLTSATIAGLLSAGTPEAREQVTVLRKVNDERQKELSALEDIYFPMGDYTSQLTVLQDLLATAQDKISNGLDPDGLYQRTLPLIQREIDLLEKKSKQLADSLKEATNAMANLGRDLTKVSIKSEAVKYENDLTSSQEKITILQEQLDSKRPQSFSIQMKLAELEYRNSTKELRRLEQEAKNLADTISSTKDHAMTTNLLAFFESIGYQVQSLNDLSYEALLSAETYKDLDDTQQEVIKSLKRQKELNILLSQAQEQNIQSLIAINDALTQRISDLRGFARSLEDLDTAVRDYLKSQKRAKEDLDISIRDYETQRVRGLEDFIRQLEDASIQYRRQQRDLLESYQDMNRQMVLQTAQVRRSIDEATRDIQRRSILNDLRKNLKLGGQGIFANFYDAIDTFFQAINDTQNEQGTLEEQRLQLQEDVIGIAKQIRGLQEQLYDMERQRILQVRDLLRQHVDYIKSQLDAHRNITRQLEDFADTNKDSLKAITRQFEDMELQAKGMGLAFGRIRDMFNGINTNYGQLSGAIGNLIGTVNNLRSQAQKELAESRKNPPVVANPPSSNPPRPTVTPNVTPNVTTVRQTSTVNPVQQNALTSANPVQAQRILNNIPASNISRTAEQQANDKHIMDLIGRFIRQGDIVVNINHRGEIKSIQAKTVQATNLLSSGNVNSEQFKTPQTFVYNSQHGAQLGTVLNNLKTWSSTIKLPNIERPNSRTNTNPYGSVNPNNTNPYGGTNPSNRNPFGGANPRNTNPYGNRSFNPFQDFDPMKYLMASSGMDTKIPFMPIFAMGAKGLIKDLREAKDLAVEIAQVPVFNPNPIIGVPDVKPLAEQQKITQEQLVETLQLQDTVTEQINIKGLQRQATELTNLKIQEFQLKTTQLQLKQFDQYRLAVNGLVTALRSQTDLLRQQLETWHNINREVKTLILNSKGYLLPSEQIDVAKTDVSEKYRNQRKSVTDLQRELTRLADQDASTAGEAIQKIIDSPLFKSLPEEMRSKLAPLIDEYGNVTGDFLTTSQGILAQMPSILDSIDKSEAIELDFVGRITRFDIASNAMQNISKVIGEMIEGNNISNPFRGADLQKQAKRAELFNKRTEMEKLFETAIPQAQGTLLNPESSKQAKELARSFLGFAEEFQQTQDALYRTAIIRSDREIDKNTAVTLMQREAEVRKALAERQKEMNPFGGGDANFAHAERLDILIRYREQLDKIRQMEESGEYSPQFAAQLKAQLDEIRDYDLSKIETKFNVFAQAIQEPMKNAFTSLFGDVVRGTKSVGDVLNEFLSQIANFFANIAAQIATNAMMDFFKNLGLFNIAGFSRGGTVTSNAGTVGNYKEGGIVALETPVASSSTMNRDAITRIANFAKGGEVLDLGLAVHQALKREGTGGVPVVAHIGEQILTTRNGDAQLFRQLQQNGQWDRIKYNFKYRGDFIPNFNNGGLVGMVTPTAKTPQGNPQGVVYNYAINVTTKDADSFRKSKSLIAQEQKLMQERNNRFN